MARPPDAQALHGRAYPIARPFLFKGEGNQRLVSWLIKPDQESLGSIDLQAIHLSLASYDAGFQSKPNDSFALCSVKRRECGTSRGLQFLLQRRDIVHHKIQLHPSGRARGAEILANDDEYVAIAIGPNAIGLRMVQSLDEESLENGLEQLFIQANVGGFNLNILKCTDELLRTRDSSESVGYWRLPPPHQFLARMQ